MAAAKIVLFTMLCFCVCANAQTQTLAVYPSHADQLNSMTTHSLNLELKRLLSPAGIDLEWRSHDRNATVPSVEGRLIVGTFEGGCSTESLSAMQGVAPHARTLAETSISGDRILPYFTLDCTHLIRMLNPLLQPLSVPMRERILGRALARVIAHEIYHIVADTTEHEEAGLAKAQLSARELAAERFDLSPASLQRIRAAYRVGPPAIPIVRLMPPPAAQRR